MKVSSRNEVYVMKVLMLNGSPKENGNTALALAEMRAVFEKEGVEVDLVHVGHLSVRGCTACGACFKQGRCVIEDDIVNELSAKLAECAVAPIFKYKSFGYPKQAIDCLFFYKRKMRHFLFLQILHQLHGRLTPSLNARKAVFF